MIINKHFY